MIASDLAGEKIVSLPQVAIYNVLTRLFAAKNVYLYPPESVNSNPPLAILMQEDSETFLDGYNAWETDLTMVVWVLLAKRQSLPAAVEDVRPYGEKIRTLFHEYSDLQDEDNCVFAELRRLRLKTAKFTYPEGTNNMYVGYVLELEYRL